jgi:hypothetical protein
MGNDMIGSTTMNKILCALLFVSFACSAEEWTAKPDGLYNPAGDKVVLAIEGAFERSDFSKQERNALIFAAIATGLDIWTTHRGLKQGGCVEKNPIFGKNPKTETLVAFGAVQMSGLYWFMQRDQKDYSKPGWIAGGAHLLAAGWNSTQKCKR